MEQTRDEFKNWVIKPEDRQPLRKPRCRHIKMNLKKVGWEGMVWIDLGHGTD